MVVEPRALIVRLLNRSAAVLVVLAGGHKLGILFRERFVDLSEEFFGRVGGSGLIDMRQAFAAWRRAVSDLNQCLCMV